jgi:hypothetical protein
MRVRITEEERVIQELEYYTQKAAGRFCVFYKGKPVWFGTRNTFKSPGMARRMLIENVVRGSQEAMDIVDKMVQDGTIKIQMV